MHPTYISDLQQLATLLRSRVWDHYVHVERGLREEHHGCCQPDPVFIPGEFGLYRAAAQQIPDPQSDLLHHSVGIQWGKQTAERVCSIRRRSAITALSSIFHICTVKHDSI